MCPIGKIRGQHSVHSAVKCLLGNQSKSFFFFTWKSNRDDDDTARVIWFHLFGHPFAIISFFGSVVHDEGDISTPSICKFIEWRSTGWSITPVVVLRHSRVCHIRLLEKKNSCVTRSPTSYIQFSLYRLHDKNLRRVISILTSFLRERIYTCNIIRMVFVFRFRNKIYTLKKVGETFNKSAR